MVNLQCYLLATWLVPHETDAVSARAVYIIHQGAIHATSCNATYAGCMRVQLAVTCQLHFWQNDQDLLRATAVTGAETDTEIRVSTEG